MKFYQGKEGRRQQGTSMVEFALISLFFFMMLIGIIDLSRAMFVFQIVSDAARLGTRYAMVRGSGCTTTGCPCTAADVQNYVRSLLPGIDPQALTVNTTWNPDNNAGSYVKVQASYVYKFVSVLPIPSVTLNSTSEVVISQ